MTTIIPINKSYIMEVAIIDDFGSFVSGSTITYQIIKSSDNSVLTSGSLTEQTDKIYTDSITFTEENQYRILYTSPSGISNGAETVLVEDADLSDLKVLLDSIFTKVCKILGLSQSNYRLTSQVYDSDGCLTSALISIYSNSLDTENQVNPICTFTLTASYDSNGRLIDYKVVEN